MAALMSSGTGHIAIYEVMRKLTGNSGASEDEGLEVLRALN